MLQHQVKTAGLDHSAVTIACFIPQSPSVQTRLWSDRKRAYDSFGGSVTLRVLRISYLERDRRVITEERDGNPAARDHPSYAVALSVVRVVPSLERCL